MKLPRGTPRLMIAAVAMLLLGGAAWWWVTWPERTKREFVQNSSWSTPKTEWEVVQVRAAGRTFADLLGGRVRFEVVLRVKSGMVRGFLKSDFFYSQHGRTYSVEDVSAFVDRAPASTGEGKVFDGFWDIDLPQWEANYEASHIGSGLP